MEYRVFLENPTVTHLMKEFSEFYGIQRLITVFTWGLPLIPVGSQMNPVHAPLLYLLSILIFSCPLLGLLSGLSPANTVHAFLFQAYYVPCPFHSTWFFIAPILMKSEFWICSVCSSPQPPVLPVRSRYPQLEGVSIPEIWLWWKCLKSEILVHIFSLVKEGLMREYCVRITDEGGGVWLWHRESFRLEGFEFSISYSKYCML